MTSENPLPRLECRSGELCKGFHSALSACLMPHIGYIEAQREADWAWCQEYLAMRAEANRQVVAALEERVKSLVRVSRYILYRSDLSIKDSVLLEKALLPFAKGAKEQP